MPEKKANKSSVPSAVQQTINYLTGAIMRREYTPGSKIPTENDLADLVGVSRNTVREAVKILVFMGVLEIRRPEGTFVCSGFSNSLIDPMLSGASGPSEGSLHGRQARSGHGFLRGRPLS